MTSRKINTNDKISCVDVWREANASFTIFQIIRRRIKDAENPIVAILDRGFANLEIRVDLIVSTDTSNCPLSLRPATMPDDERLDLSRIDCYLCIHRPGQEGRRVPG